MKDRFKFNPDYLRTKEDFIRIVNEMRDEYLQELKLINKQWIEGIQNYFVERGLITDKEPEPKEVPIIKLQDFIKYLKSKMEAKDAKDN